MFCLRSFISNKEHWQEKELQSFIYLDDILYFFFKVGHTTTVFCPLPFQKKSPYHRSVSDLSLIHI